MQSFTAEVCRVLLKQLRYAEFLLKCVKKYICSLEYARCFCY